MPLAPPKRPATCEIRPRTSSARVMSAVLDFAAHHQRGSTLQTEIHPHLLTTGLDNGAKELIWHSTTSSPRISTAPGVPVQITSPGRSVMTFE